jgi:DNA transformation protein and related proteins
MASNRRPASKRPNPLKVSAGFRAFVLDQLEDLGDVVPRSMFGGVGLYHEGVFFGLIAGDILYLKVDSQTRSDYERAGSHAFRPYPDRAGTMQYFAVPLAVLESRPELTRWARKAVSVAENAMQASPPSARRQRDDR